MRRANNLTSKNISKCFRNVIVRCNSNNHPLRIKEEKTMIFMFQYEHNRLRHSKITEPNSDFIF